MSKRTYLRKIACNLIERNRFKRICLCSTLVLSVLTILSGCNSEKKGPEPAPSAREQNTAPNSQAREWLSIMGGASGGSFSQFAGAVGRILEQHEPHIKISIDGSAGSIENTRRVNRDAETLGVVFASEAYLGYHGLEIFAKEEPKSNLRVVTLLFIAYDQMSTLANSGVHQFEDIVGKKVACGASGSGTAQTLERLTKLAGIWGEFTPIYKGGTAGAEALQDGQVAAFQWLVSIPNSAIIQLTTIKSIRMLDLDTPARKYGFYEKYPFYQSGKLPAGAYEGKVRPVKTILMPTVLIAHKEIHAETIYAILKHVYAPEGRKTLLSTTQAAADMTIENAPQAFVIPLHDGAYQFWNEQQIEIPKHAMPVE